MHDYIISKQIIDMLQCMSYVDPISNKEILVGSVNEWCVIYSAFFLVSEEFC